MPVYTVTWEMEFEAVGAVDAARQALKVQRNQESIATVFHVREGEHARRAGDAGNEDIMRVDLWEGTIDGLPIEKD